MMKLDPGAWAIFPQQRVTGNRSHSICHNKVILSPASGRRYRCNSHPLLQKSNLQCMRVSVTWTLQHLLLITVKYRDWGSCHYNLSLQQAWFWCRISLIMFHETSLQKASSWGEQGSMMEEQPSAVEWHFAAPFQGATPTFGGPPLHQPIGQSGWEAVRLANTKAQK